MSAGVCRGVSSCPWGLCGGGPGPGLVGFLWGSPKAFGGDVAGHSEAGDSSLCRAASRLGQRGSARSWRPGLPGVLLRWISGGVTGTPGRPGACWIVESWRFARAVGPLERMPSKLAGISVPLVEPGTAGVAASRRLPQVSGQPPAPRGAGVVRPARPALSGVGHDAVVGAAGAGAAGAGAVATEHLRGGPPVEFHQVSLRAASVQTGREQCSDHAEYLSRSGAPGGYLRVGDYGYGSPRP